MIAKTEKRQLYRQLKYKSPENTGLSGLYCGETGTRTLATVTRRQISNLLHYHSGTSPKLLGNANVIVPQLENNTFFDLRKKLFWIGYPKMVYINQFF